MNQAVKDILAERTSQIAQGWTSEHDDEHTNLALSRAAGIYIDYRYARHPDAEYPPGEPPFDWPWEDASWKPRTYRENLIRAAALLIAEIERLDRRTK